MVAFSNGFLPQKLFFTSYITGFLMLNFTIAIFINPKFAPTFFLGSILVCKLPALLTGAIQKKYAWSLGLTISIVIFILYLLLQNDPS